MESNNDFLEKILETIRNKEEPVAENDLLKLFAKLEEVLLMENNVLELTSPIIICGDIHGQLYDLFQLFDAVVPAGFGTTKFLFMGDYVDRGRFSTETFAYLAALKLRYSDNFYLLRGNHECRQVNQTYGFYNEILSNFGHSGMWARINEVFDLLPMAALIDNQIFSIHGGLSRDIVLIESISIFDRKQELPIEGPLCDLCWSDPEENATEWTHNQRGAGWVFGKPQVDQFLHNNGLSLITRSHQLAMEGFQYYFNKSLITIWSAPNYMYRSGNKASVMKCDGTGNEELILFDKMPDNKRKKPEELTQLSTYFL